MAVITTLLLTRHGEAHCNIAGVAGGQKGCTGLTEHGRQQVRLLAERLRAGEPPDVLYASPRRRTLESAGILSAVLGLQVRIDPGLRGPDHGQADGQSWNEIKTAFGGPPQSDPDRPYAPGSETWNQYLARAVAALGGLIERHYGQRILIAGHGETAEAAASLLLELPPGSCTRIGFQTDHAAITCWYIQRKPAGPAAVDTPQPQRHPAPRHDAVTILPALCETARQILGPCEVTATTGSAVAWVTTANGTEFVIKQHDSRAKHDREVRAYRHWTLALGSSAPELVAADPRTMIVITTALPGHPNPGDVTTSVSRQAGTLLRCFHDAETPRELPWFRDWLRDRARYWASQARTLLTPADAAVIAAHLAALEHAAIPPGSPCHLDYQPRNWLINESGTVSLIDFEHSRIDLPARDLVRLRFRVWPDRPDLRDAFFEGYGRPLTETEDELLWHLGAIDVLTALARGRDTRNPELTAFALGTLRQLRASG